MSKKSNAGGTPPADFSKTIDLEGEDIQDLRAQLQAKAGGAKKKTKGASSGRREDAPFAQTLVGEKVPAALAAETPTAAEMKAVDVAIVDARAFSTTMIGSVDDFRSPPASAKARGIDSVPFAAPVAGTAVARADVEKPPLWLDPSQPTARAEQSAGPTGVEPAAATANPEEEAEMLALATELEAALSELDETVASLRDVIAHASASA